ncbi:unnamed protein product [Strongylus vulgaris]|uniref:Uncharacterized protein n=1 Tax=Strongylus vulgaris TaxID=40348 RepID=A0A3P7HZP0_STRVU|nr:unnamed protein product [Strongylus vulgaris]
MANLFHAGTAKGMARAATRSRSASVCFRTRSDNIDDVDIWPLILNTWSLYLFLDEIIEFVLNFRLKTTQHYARYRDFPDNEAVDAGTKEGDTGEAGMKEKKEEKKGNGLVDNIDISREARNRVKLYVLCDQRVWDDRGTGHVACVQIPNQQGFVIIVRLESATSGQDKNVLESKILMDTVYQKQQVGNFFIYTSHFLDFQHFLYLCNRYFLLADPTFS